MPGFLTTIVFYLLIYFIIQLVLTDLTSKFSRNPEKHQKTIIVVSLVWPLWSHLILIFIGLVIFLIVASQLLKSFNFLPEDNGEGDGK